VRGDVSRRLVCVTFGCRANSIHIALVFATPPALAQPRWLVHWPAGPRPHVRLREAREAIARQLRLFFQAAFLTVIPDQDGQAQVKLHALRGAAQARGWLQVQEFIVDQDLQRGAGAQPWSRIGGVTRSEEGWGAR
jgi:hypothetical protein